VWRRVSITSALALGPGMIILTVLRNWHGWAPWPFWIDDLAAGALLMAAGAYAIKDKAHLRGRLLGAALGLATATLWASLFEGLAGIQTPPEEWSAVPGVSFALTLLAFLAAVVGLSASLPSAKRPLLGTRSESEMSSGTRNARR